MLQQTYLGTFLSASHYPETKACVLLLQDNRELSIAKVTIGPTCWQPWVDTVPAIREPEDVI